MCLEFVRLVILKSIPWSCESAAKWLYTVSMPFIKLLAERKKFNCILCLCCFAFSQQNLKTYVVLHSRSKTSRHTLFCIFAAKPQDMTKSTGKRTFKPNYKMHAQYVVRVSLNFQSLVFLPPLVGDFYFLQGSISRMIPHRLATMLE